jgi:hypothetical protein
MLTKLHDKIYDARELTQEQSHKLLEAADKGEQEVIDVALALLASSNAAIEEARAMLDAAEMLDKAEGSRGTEL